MINSHLLYQLSYRGITLKSLGKLLWVGATYPLLRRAILPARAGLSSPNLSFRCINPRNRENATGMAGECSAKRPLHSTPLASVELEAGFGAAADTVA